MRVKLVHYTPLFIVSKAIRTCYDSHDKSDGGDKDRDLIDRIGNRMKHESVKNHCHYTFDIQGISTKTLLALTRHDVGVEFSVQSTRFTTKKSVENGTAGYSYSKSDKVNEYLDQIELMVIDCVNSGVKNDDVSMLLPQAWRYNLVCTMSMTALQHFLALRTSREAHYDIMDLAYEIYEALPSEHVYLFKDFVKDYNNG